MLQPKDSELPPSDRLISRDRQGFLTDILFEWALEENRPPPSTINVEILVPGTEDGQPLLLEKISREKWEHDGIIKFSKEITFIAKSEEAGDLGHVQLTRNEIGEIITPPSLDDRFTLYFRNKVDAQSMLSMTMSFRVPAAESKEDATVHSNQLESVDHSAAHDPHLLLTATSLLPEDDVEKPLKLRICGHLFLKRFRSSRSKDDIDNSVKAFERARQLGSTDIHFLDFEYDYATALLERHNLTHDLADINRSISSLENVVHGTTHESTELAHRLGFLSSLFVIRFKSTNDLADISQAIEKLQMAINVTPNGDTNLPSRLNTIAIFLRRRFRSTGNLADISEGIVAQQKLVDLMPEEDPEMPGWLDNLAFSLECRFQHTGDLDDITSALSILSRAINLTLGVHTDMAERLSRRGILLRMKFQRTGNFVDISDAIKDQENAISLIPADSDHQMHQLFGNLGSSYLSQFDETGDPEDISEAITALEQAVHLTPEDDPDSALNWSNFGNAFIRRFECTGDLSDISESIHAQQKALGLMPDDDDKLPFLLNNLGLSFQTRFDVTGDLIDISEAIAAHQKSIHLTPEGHASMSNHLNNLGTSFQCRSQRTGDITDISEAIDAHRKSVRLCPEGHPSMPTLLSNLGNSLCGRFESTNNIADISEAISSHQEAVRLTSEKHPAMAGQLDNLGISLRNRFGLSGNMNDIDTAISVAERAVKSTPEDDPSIPSRLNNLGIALHTRFKRTKTPTDIFEAVLRQERAIYLTPVNHASLPGLLNNLGLSLEDRFELMDDLTDIKGAVAAYKLAASSITGPPSARLRAAINWATASRRMEDQSESLDGYKTAIELISRVAGMEYTIGLRHRILVDNPDLSNAAAATAFSLGKPKIALEWLEQGRCLVWNQLNNLRTPLDDLASFDSQLADDLSRISQSLENAGLRDESVLIGTDADIMVEKMALQDEATASVKLAQEWEQLLEKIRDIPKFKDFLRPTRYCDLIARLPKAGPVVVINVHEDRCDAVALVPGTDDPPHIHLDQFSYEDAVRLLQVLRSHLSAHRARIVEESDELEPVNETRGVVPFVMIGETMEDVLRELWLGVVKPILNALNILHPETLSDLSRIWWCPTGPLSFLPIHAAGLYNEAQTDCIFDYAVSSYTPTVSSFLERTRVSQTTEQVGKVLVIGQPNAPGLPRLPGTKRELKAIQEKFNTANIPFLSLEGDPATIDRTMKELELHSCIHFACHGVQDAKHPLRSGFYLSDGRLELWKVLQIQNTVADFAFLSACQTSKGEEGLPEEVIHLAAGLLAAGYRGVVGTMWSIQDRYGLKVAEEFYTDLISRRMREGRVGLVGSVCAAHALHYAIQRLREELGDSPSALLTWVPYVHMGV